MRDDNTPRPIASQPSHSTNGAGSTDAVRLRFVCILAVPRTGSTVLIRLLQSVAGLNVKGELFHPTWIGHLDERDWQGLRGAADRRIADPASLRVWRAANPAAALDALFDTGRERTIVFKLFPGHLTRQRLKSAIFTRKDIGYIVLRRRPIDSFISNLKAISLNVFNNFDTTGVKPILDVPGFVGWAGRTRAWYDWLADELAAAPRRTAEMSYERHIDLGDPSLVLAKALDALQSLGLERPAVVGELRSPGRQDREPRYQDRVANWAEFEADMRAEESRAALLDWATATA